MQTSSPSSSSFSLRASAIFAAAAVPLLCTSYVATYWLAVDVYAPVAAVSAWGVLAAPHGRCVQAYDNSSLVVGVGCAVGELCPGMTTAP